MKENCSFFFLSIFFFTRICYNIAFALCFWIWGHKTCGILGPHPGGQTCMPCFGRWSFNHWITKKVSIVPFKKMFRSAYTLRIISHWRNIKYYNCHQKPTMMPPVPSLWQWLLLTNGELDEMSGLIPNRTPGVGDEKLLPTWETHQLLSWQSEWSGGRVSSVPSLLPPFIIYQGLWCASQCEWEEIKVLSSNPSLEIPFVRSLQMTGQKRALHMKRRDQHERTPYNLSLPFWKASPGFIRPRANLWPMEWKG